MDWEFGKGPGGPREGRMELLDPAECGAGDSAAAASAAATSAGIGAGNVAGLCASAGATRDQ